MNTRPFSVERSTGHMLNTSTTLFAFLFRQKEFFSRFFRTKLKILALRKVSGGFT